MSEERSVSEIEQLRKEINELRERLAILEARKVPHPPIVPMRDQWKFAPDPLWLRQT